MSAATSIDGDSVTVDVKVTNETKTAAELAAIAASKPVSELMQGLLVEHLIRSGHLPATIDTSNL